MHLDDQDPPRWFVGESSGQTGPFTDAEIRRRHAAGELAGILLWAEGQADWLPSEQILNVRPPITPASLPVFEEPARPYDLPTEPPASGVKHVRYTVGALVAILLAALCLWLIHRADAWPNLVGVTEAEVETLKTAARTNLTRGGLTAAIAMSTNDIVTPTFFIAGNAGENETLTLQVSGLAETLLDGFKAEASTSVRLHDGLARTQPFRQKNGLPFKRGDYSVTVLVHNTPLAQKVFFIGGAKDPEYERLLSRYHDELRRKAADEIQDLKQLSETLARQLEALRAHTARSKSTRRQTWAAFNANWRPLQNQLAQVFSAWTEDTFENQVFFGHLYRTLRSKIDATAKLARALEVNPSATEDLTRLETSVQDLLSRIVLNASLSPSANGMPRRDQP